MNQNAGVDDQEKTLQRIARGALRRVRRTTVASDRVAAIVRDTVRRIPNAAALDHSELVAYVARQLRSALQTDDVGRPLNPSEARETVVPSKPRTFLVR